MKCLKIKSLTTLAITLLLFVTGCSQENKELPRFTKETCIKGVMYYSSGYRLAAAFKPNGSLYLCNTTSDKGTRL